MKFVEDPFRSTNWFSCVYLFQDKAVTEQNISVVFPGAERPDPYYDPEAGYEQNEFGFKDGEGNQYNVYFRHGNPRVSTRFGSKQNVDLFVRWLVHGLRKR